MAVFHLKKYSLQGKKVILRVDYNVPLKEGKVLDNTKIKLSLPTIKFLLEKKCKIILATHLGRPDGEVVSSLSTAILAKELSRVLKHKVIHLDNCIGRVIKKKIEQSKEKIFMLENLRFYKEEENNDSFFAHSLASLADIYVNDAFAVSHRKHASLYAITRQLPSIPGLLLVEEIKNLSKVLKPKRPAVWILGGAKLNKIRLITSALKKADYILLGGALVFPFLKAKNISVGMSKIDSNAVRLAKKILQKKEAKKIILPLDFTVAETLSPKSKSKVLPYNHLNNNYIALDLGPKTIKLFQDYMRKAHTIFWNGPLGYYEWHKFSLATKEIGRFMGRLTATTIAGGGETNDAIHKFNLEEKFTHVSTGGGAALAFLSGGELPALDALEKSYQKFRPKN